MRPEFTRQTLLRHLVWAVVVISAALLQTTWLEAIKLQGVQPDLVLLLVVYFAITDSEERSMFTGVLGGMYQDVAGKAVLGHHILCNAIVGFLVGRVSMRLITDHPAVKVGLVFCASLLNGTLFTAVQYVQHPDIGPFRMLLTSVIPGAFYTALMTPLVFFILGKLFRGREAAQGEAL
jgi:rod shape-determining protein MreD